MPISIPDTLVNTIQFCWFIAAEFSSCSIISSLWTSASVKAIHKKGHWELNFSTTQVNKHKNNKMLFNCTHTSIYS